MSIKTINVRTFISNTRTQVFQVPHPRGCKRNKAKAHCPDVNEKVLRIACHMGTENDVYAGVNLVNKLKEKSVKTFEMSMGTYLDAQDNLKKLETHEGSLDHYLRGVRRTRLHSGLLAKILRCARYLTKADAPRKCKGNKPTFHRYKIDDVSFSLERKGKSLESIIVHFKKKKKNDFSAEGGLARVSKAVRFTTSGWEFLAERCNFNFQSRETRISQDFKSKYVIAPPKFFNIEHFGVRLGGLETASTAETSPKPPAASAADGKPIVKKNTSYMQFFELDLYQIAYNYSTWLTMPRIHQILLCIAKGIFDIHRKDHINCDIKLENVVLDLDHNKELKSLKIIDLDLVTTQKKIDELKKKVEREKTDYRTHWCGTEEYWPPNFKEYPQDSSADIYAFGNLGMFLLQRASHIPAEEKRELQKVLSSCRNSVPKKRPSAKKLVNKLEKIQF